MGSMMSATEYAVFHRLLKISDAFTRVVAFSIFSLAEDLGLTPAQVQAAIECLEQSGYISGMWAECQGNVS
jgi:DNA-binding MarR family transcriptional regulator